MARIRTHLSIPNLVGALLFVVVIGGAVALAATSRHNAPSVAFLWAAILTALGIRIWVRWGFEDPYSIPACFGLALVTLAAGFGWI